MSCVSFFFQAGRILSFCAALLLPMSLGYGQTYRVLQNGAAGYQEIAKLYVNKTPIAIGQVTAINGKQLPEPACLMIIAGTYLPQNLKDLLPGSVATQAGVLQDLTTGSGGIPIRPILQILSPGNPAIAMLPTTMNMPGTERGYSSYTRGIETAVRSETTYCHPGSKVVVLAHSLGCMEMQRILASSFFKDQGLQLLEADFYGCPQLKALPADAQNVSQFFVGSKDPVAYFPDLARALHNAGLPGIIANLMLPYDQTRTFADEIHDLTQDWKVPQKMTPVPSQPGCDTTVANNHMDVYANMSDKIPLAPETKDGDTGGKTINADLHYHSASPDLNALLNVSETRSCVLLKSSIQYNEPQTEQSGSAIVKYWQQKNSTLPPPPMVNH